MQTLSDHYEKSERSILFLVYILHILLFTAPLGLLINAIKARQYQRLLSTDRRAHAESVRIAYEHHVWLLHTIAVVMILLMIGIGTAYSVVGFPVLIGAAAWWVYRMFKGMLTLAENHHLPVAT